MWGDVASAGRRPRDGLVEWRWLCSADPMDFYHTVYPGIAKIERPLPTSQAITKSWQTDYDWFTVAPRLYVPGKQTSAGHVKEWCQTLLQPHEEKELQCEASRPFNDVPARKASANSEYVNSLPLFDKYRYINPKLLRLLPSNGGTTYPGSSVG